MSDNASQGLSNFAFLPSSFEAIALTESDASTLERLRQKVIEIAMLLEEKTSIPAVKEQLSYLSGFWDSPA